MRALPVRTSPSTSRSSSSSGEDRWSPGRSPSLLALVPTALALVALAGMPDPGVVAVLALSGVSVLTLMRLGRTKPDLGAPRPT